MRQGHYIQLANPVTVRVANDPESPSVQAKILKILKVNGLDELHEKEYIEFCFGYGYINSQKKFILLEKNIHVESVIDVPDDGTGNGINICTNLREPSGNWFSRIAVPPVDQPNRTRGDFRLVDLYQHVMDKYGIVGTIKKEAP